MSESKTYVFGNDRNGGYNNGFDPNLLYGMMMGGGGFGGFGGGGSDYVSKNPNNQENPFGGGVGAGAKVTPVAFLIIKDGATRMIPVPVPANTTVDRVVEMVPDTLDKIASFIESKTEKKAE